MDISFEAQKYLNKAQQGCIKEALSFLDGVTEDDLWEFMGDTKRIALEKNISLADAAKESKFEFAKQLSGDLYGKTETYQKLFNPENGIWNLVDKKKISSFDVTSKNTRKYGGLNIENQQTATKVILYQQFFKPLSKTAQNIAMSGKYDKVVAQMYDGADVPEELPEEIKVALQEYVSSLKNMIEKHVPFQMLSSTARTYRRMNKYRLMRPTYDYKKVLQKPDMATKLNRYRLGKKIESVPLDVAKKHFIAQMTKRSRPELMMPLAPDLESATEEALGNMFDNITTFGKSYSINIKDEPEIRKRGEAFVIWKDMQSYLDHQQEFGIGRGTLYESMMSEINSAGNAAGLSKVLGSDPDWAFGKIMKISQKRWGNRVVSDTSHKFTNAEHIYARLRGLTQIPYNPTVAEISANLNAWTTMSKGLTWSLTTLNDTNFGLHLAQQYTESPYWKLFADKVGAFGKELQHVVSGSDRDPIVQRAILNMSDALHGEVGSMARFSDSTNMGEGTRYISNKFFMVNGMSIKDLSYRSNAVIQATGKLGILKDRTFEELPEGVRKRMQSFNITSPEWDELRKKSDGGFIAADTAASIPTEGYQRIAEALKTNPITAKHNLCSKMFGFAEAAADETILFPGAQEHAFWERGTQAGTPWGTIARTVGQFKGFLSAYTNRILINGYQNSPNKWAFLISNFAYTLPITMLGTAMYELGHGRIPNLDPSTWTEEDIITNLLPSYAILGKSLNPRSNNPEQLASTLLMSPSMKTLFDTAVLGLSAANVVNPLPTAPPIGEKLSTVGRKAGTLAYDATPIGSVPYLSSWWKQHLT